MTIYKFKHCEVRLINDVYLETVFEDGYVCKALFTETEENKNTARDCGYSDTKQMHLEHEIAHTFLSEELGRPWSYVLRRVALNELWTFNQERSDEEAIVLAFQTYMNTGLYSSWLDCFNDPYALAMVFKACYR